MQEDNFTEQYILRVKRNSELDNYLRATDGTPATLVELEEAMGNKNGRWLPTRLPRWFDNVGLVKDNDTFKTLYTNVMPNQVKVVTSDVNFHADGASEVASADSGQLESKMRWPIAPPLIDKMENFDRPRWYGTMKTMVEIGRHISIEGPPSVGKDTAVEQLAAEVGKPLVTIGGDAGFRTRDLTGGQQLVNGTSFFDIGEYIAAAVNGWWVLLTEVNAADPSALMYINRQLAAPYVVNLGGKAYPVHKDFRLFVTYNHGLVGTKPLPQSFKDRFFSVKVPFFTESQLRKRLEMMGWSYKPEHERGNVIVVQYGIALWDAHERGQMRYQITTRRLKDAIDLMVVGEVPVDTAIKAAVIDAIDSPVEAKAALSVLNNVIGGM